MSKRILAQDLKEHVGEEVSISGWVDVRRDHGKLIFLVIRDRSGTVQIVSTPQNETTHAIAETLRDEWVVMITGEVKNRPENMVQDEQNGNIELSASEIVVLNTAEELPFTNDAEVNIDTLLDYRPLTLRRKRERAIFRVQSDIIGAYRSFLRKDGGTEIQAPKLVGKDAEGGGEVFDLDYFNGKRASLATSPQLYKQMMVGVYERVFTTGNVFRAEKHSTTRHLNEYTSIDAEFGFIADHFDIMRIETALIKYIIAHLQKNNAVDFEVLGASIPVTPEGNLFPHMKLREAQELIKEKTGQDKTSEPDLEPEDERWLSVYAREELGSDFVFITHYPVSKRPFYTYEDEADPGYTKSFDLLFRGVEITTGGQRIHDPEVLIAKMKEKGLQPKDFSFYLQAFKFGIPPHGGWGMGLERLTQKFLNLPNVKEATLFPRDIHRIDTRLTSETTKGN